MPRRPSAWPGRWLRAKRPQDERWSVLQVEVTSRCSSRCTFCPSKTIGHRWLAGDLPYELFRDRIAPHLARFDLAYLQGWGEPLLHPHIWEMLALARRAGCRVGFTTCGSHLDGESIDRLLGEGLDVLSISFAGASQATHESLRVGSNYAQLVKNVEELTARRTRMNDSRLEIELHFLMIRSNIHELPAFVRLAASLGVDQVVATNLTYTPTRALDAERVFARAPEPAHTACVEAGAAEARKLGIGFRAYPLAMDASILECDAHPSETAFVNHLGLVAPCVYLGMPVKDRIPRCFLGNETETAPLNFGTVGDGVIEAMQGSQRSAFTSEFRSRKAHAYTALAAAFADHGGDAVALPPPPAGCQTCYKLFGV